MKKKKLKKLANLISQEMMSLRNQVEKIREKVEWSEYDPNISDKFKKMYFNLLNCANNLRFEVSDDRISMSTDDINSLKKGQKNKLNSEDDYLRIEIIKNEGFIISRGYNMTSNYADSAMFDDVIDKTTERKKQINLENFSSIFDEIMVLSGLARDNNLNEIFNV